MKSYEASESKQQCRDKLVEYTGQARKVVTLPSRTALCIKTFKKAWPKANYIGIERDKDSWQEIIDQGIDCYNTDVRQYFHSQTLPSQHTDLIFLDYYSYLNSNILGDLKAVVENNNLTHPGKSFVVGLTLMKAMRGDKVNTIDFMREYIYNGHRQDIDNTLDNVESALSTFLGSEFPNAKSIQCLDAIEYMTGTPMYFLVFKIRK